MAVIPKYSQKIGAPGPVPYNIGTGPLYNQGLSILADASRDTAGALAANDRQLRDAYESTEITKRAAQFSLDTQNLLQRATELQVSEPALGPADEMGNRPTVTRLAHPDEQKQFFQGEIGKLEEQYSAWEKGLYGRNVSVESKARLRRTMMAETAQQIGNFRAIQQQRQIENIRDGLQFALDAAVQTGSTAAAHEVVYEAVRVGALSSAKGEEILQSFPVDVQLSDIRKQMDMLDQAEVPFDVKIEGLQSLSRQADGLLQGDLTEVQRNALLHVKNAADDYAGKQKVLKAETLKQNDALVAARTLRTERGAATGAEAVTPEELEVRMARGEISEDLGRMMWDRLMRKQEAKEQEEKKTKDKSAEERDRQQKLRVYAIVNSELLAYKEGHRSYADFFAVLKDHMMLLDTEDAEMFIDKSANARSTEGDHAAAEADRMVENALKPFFVMPKDKEHGNETWVDEIGLFAAKGEVMRNLNEWSGTHFAGKTVFDAQQFRVKANELLQQSIEQRKTQLTRPGWFSRRRRPIVTRITNDSEYEALASGTRFIGPDGVERTKP